MLCSVCKKNTAVIFINKQGQDNKSELQGLCYSCASKMGVNPIDSLAKQANLSDKDISNMTDQLENLFSNLSGNIDGDEALNNVINESSEVDSPDGIPLGSIFSGIFNLGGSDNTNASNSTQKVKEKSKTDILQKADL